MTDFEFMTYAEAARRLGIAPASVKRQAARRSWPKRQSNDGRVMVGIPVDRLSSDGPFDCRGDSQADGPPSPVHAQIARLEAELAGIRELLGAERRRAETAESDRDRWHALAIRPWWKRLVG